MYIVMLLLLLLPPAPIQRSVRLIVVQPPYETVDAAAIQTAQQGVRDAATFWRMRAPFVVDLVLVSTEVITIEGDVYRDTAWSIGLADPNYVTIVIIDNRKSGGKLLLGRQGGWAQPWNALAVMLLRQSVGQNALPAMIAHELGHVLFDLPDLYVIPGACSMPDIMCYQIVAYNTPTIGCVSVARLGYPCKRVYLPVAMGGGG